MFVLNHYKELPVFRVTFDEWRYMKTENKNAFYAIADDLYYCDRLIGKIDMDGNILEFDEEDWYFINEDLKRRGVQMENAIG